MFQKWTIYQTMLTRLTRNREGGKKKIGHFLIEIIETM